MKPDVHVHQPNGIHNLKSQKYNLLHVQLTPTQSKIEVPLREESIIKYKI